MPPRNASKPFYPSRLLATIGEWDLRSSCLGTARKQRSTLTEPPRWY